MGKGPRTIKAAPSGIIHTQYTYQEGVCMFHLRRHRGYDGFAMYEDGTFIGQIVGLAISFESTTLSGVQEGFEEAVDYYLDN